MHKSIQTVVNEVWFHNRNADAVKLQEEFCKPNVGLSPFLLGLVFTAVRPHLPFCSFTDCFPQIEGCLDEWETGERTSINFSAALYNDKYRAHIALISELAERNQDAVKKLCVKIMKRSL